MSRRAAQNMLTGFPVLRYAARALTVILVEKASSSGRRVEIPDDGLQGLYLVIQPSGAKSWAYRYRLNGKTRKYTIGAFPNVDLVNARKLARDTADPYTPPSY